MRCHLALASAGLTALIFTARPPDLVAQQEDSTLSVERIVATGDFTLERFGPARWSADGESYTTLERAELEKSGSGGAGRNIVRHWLRSGKEEVVVPAARLIPPGREQALSIEDYAWSADGHELLIFTNTRRVWRLNTRGDYWILDTRSGQLAQVGVGLPEASLMFAKISPAGGEIAYVYADNLYVEDLESGDRRQITRDGGGHLINGTFDWVYEEEFSLRDGYRWSPDGRWIAYWQIDTEGVPIFHLVNNTDSLYPELTPIPYPKVGQTNPASRVGVVSAQGGETLWFDPPGNPRDHYIARMEWADSSDEIVMQRLPRRQDENHVMLGDVRTGELRPVFVDRDAAWVDVCDDLQWTEGGRYFTWVSERDGWRHVYLVARDGSEVRLITPGDYDVMQVVRITSEASGAEASGEAAGAGSGWVTFVASLEDPTQRYLYRVPLAGGAAPERLTPAGNGGWHGYDVSPDGAWAFHTASRFGTPPVTELIRLPSHERVRVLAENKEVRRRTEALARGPADLFRVEIEAGVTLDAWAIFPPGFDPARAERHPLLFYVYGEPAGTTVTDRWGGTYYLWHLMLAQRGAVVMSVDNRGTPVPRGREWRKSVFGQIGVQASRDQAAAARRILADRPYLDPERVGIWGWSGGGSMSLNMLFRHPELYRTAVAVAPVPDQRLYDSIYQERYMGPLDENREGYRQGSPITFADQLRGNLLIIHGTGDDNCHYQGTERLINRLIALDKPFSMMAYPNRTHAIREGEGTRRHLFDLMTRFLERHLIAP